MLLLILGFLVLNIVAISLSVWTEPSDMSLCYPRTLNGQYRKEDSFNLNPVLPESQICLTQVSTGT